MHSSRCSPGWKQYVPANPRCRGRRSSLVRLNLQLPSVAATYTGASFGMPSRQPGCTVAPVPRAGSNLCRRNPRSGGRRPSLVRRKTASGMAAAWLAAAGSNLSCPYFLEAGSNLCSSSPLFPEGSPLFPEAGSNLYRRNFCYAKQAQQHAQ